MKYKTASSILGLSALVSLSIILVCGCGRKEVKEKTALELRNIDSIAVLYTSAPKDTFKLSPVQITHFVTAWNKASNARLLKTQAELQLIVKEESGKERHFRVGNNRIKEDDDWAFTATEDLF